MNVIYHRGVQQDVSAVLAYYDQAAGSELGDAFFTELMAHVEFARMQPTRFHPVEGDLRRVNLDRFPYHFLFRIHGDTMRVLVVRHHRRHPRYGTRRS